VNTPTLPPWRTIYERYAPFLALVCLLIAIAAAVGTVVNDRANQRQDREQLEANTANAVTSCENANETREASRTLWNFVLDLSASSNKDATPEEIGYREEFRDWIAKVYEARDCQDLSRKYPIPPPPTIPGR
jgi:hypothetical protein